MPKSILRWIIYLAAVLAAGPLAGLATAWLRAPDGGSDATPLASSSPVLGLAAGLGAVLLAMVVGLVAGRLVGIKAGMSAAGLVLAWAAWRTGTIDHIIRGAGSGRVLWRLAIEGVLFGAAGVAVALLLSRLGTPDHHDEHGRDAKPGDGHEPRRFSLDPKLLAGPVAAGLVAGGVAAWLIAQTPLKGQAVAAAIIGAIAAAAAGRLVDYRAALPTLAIPIALLAVLGPLSGMVMGASPDVLVAGRNGALFPLANILPLDWIAGGLLGIPLGVAWAGSLIEKRTETKR